MKTRSQTQTDYLSHNMKVKKQFDFEVNLDCIEFKYSKFGTADKNYTKDLYISIFKKFDDYENNKETARVYNFYMKDSEQKEDNFKREGKIGIRKLKPCCQIKPMNFSAKKI